MDNKDKNIWIFHHYATPPTMNGFTRPYEFGKHLKGKGYNTTVFSASYLHFSDVNLINDSRLYILNNDSEVPFVFINTATSANSGIKRVLNMIEFYRNLFKTVKKYTAENEKPDLILASSPHPLTMVAGIKIAKMLGVPCICEVRDFWPEVFFRGEKLKEQSLLGKLLIKGEYWIYKKADALIFLKEGDTEYLLDKDWTLDQGGDIDLGKCHYINNGVDITTFNNQINNNILKDKDLTGDKFNVVYTGAIRPVNNVGNILDAAKILKEHKNLQFLIYGDGNQITELKDRIVKEGITNVKMKGYIDKKYIPYVLSKSSVNLLNYSQKNYNWARGNSSNKLFEYMASGKPIISTVKMGYSVINKYNCGLELNNSTPEELAEAILKIKNMSKECYINIGNNAKTGVENFNFNVLTNKLVEVINDVVKE